MENSLIIHTDGGARGNPGPGACAFVIEKKGEVLVKESKYLGKVTNNFAEYQGVLFALSNPTAQSSEEPINFFLDSELVVKQLTGLYKIKNSELLKLNIQIKTLIAKSNLQVFFKHVPRSKNKAADFLVNEELDKIVSGKIM